MERGIPVGTTEQGIPADKTDMAKILIVEDNYDYRELLLNFLDSAGYEVAAAKDGEEALLAARQGCFDLILLDVMLPKMDGYGVCREIRKISSVPVIMLTALGSEEHQMRGYELQIDGYVTKPVSMPLLIQKVEAVLRRTLRPKVQRLSFENISMDLKAHTVTVAGEPAEFTLREFEILKELMLCPGEVVTRKSLVEKLWGYDSLDGDETRIVDTHIKNIRRKLAGSNCIGTIRGVGYRLQSKSDAGNS